MGTFSSFSFFNEVTYDWKTWHMLSCVPHTRRNDAPRRPPNLPKAGSEQSLGGKKEPGLKSHSLLLLNSKELRNSGASDASSPEGIRKSSEDSALLVPNKPSVLL